VIGLAVSCRIVTIIPDTKDWTWVLQRPCPECGFDTQRFAREAVADMTRVNAAAWHDLLTGPTLLASGGRPPQTPPSDVRRRPAPETWSALEYGCHVRDVFRRFDGRLAAMLTEDGPRFANWDQDATAVADCYGDQEPVAVAAQLREAAEALAARFDTVSGDQWQRTGARSDGAAFTVESFGRYFIHDPVHHLYDVTRAQHAQPQDER
jgi:hypothetical protein